MNLVRLDYRKKDKEDKYPLTACLACGKLNHMRRNGLYCDMHCFYKKLGMVQ